jgi:hypothetical protein
MGESFRIEPFHFFFFLMLAFGALAWWLHARRGRHMEEMARERGWRWEEKGLPFPADDPVWTSALLKSQRPAPPFLTLRGTAHALEFVAFEFSEGSGKSKRLTTVVAFSTRGMRLPAFTLTRENVLHRVAGAVAGYQDVDFDEFPVFSRTFLLRGPDEAALRAWFTPSRLNALERARQSRLRWNLESAHDWLLYYHRRRLPPRDYATFIEDAARVVTPLRGSILSAGLR